MGLEYIPAALAKIVELPFSYADFTGAVLTKTISGIYTLDAGEQLINVMLQHDAAFTVGSGTLLTAAISVKSGVTVIGSLDVKQTAGFGAFFFGRLANAATASIDLNLTLTTTLATCNDLNAGSGKVKLVITNY